MEWINTAMDQYSNLIFVIVAISLSIFVIGVFLMFWVVLEINSLLKEAQRDQKKLLKIIHNLEYIINHIQHELNDFKHRIIEIETKKNGEKK